MGRALSAIQSRVNFKLVQAEQNAHANRLLVSQYLLNTGKLCN